MVLRWGPRDITTVKLVSSTEEEIGTIIISSVYLLYDAADEPLLRELTSLVKERNLSIDQ